MLLRKVREEVWSIDRGIMTYASNLACQNEDVQKLKKVDLSFSDKLKETG